jgi:hypothetical protein
VTQATLIDAVESIQHIAHRDKAEKKFQGSMKGLQHSAYSAKPPTGIHLDYRKKIACRQD